jgi:hypothetical protein
MPAIPREKKKQEQYSIAHADDTMALHYAQTPITPKKADVLRPEIDCVASPAMESDENERWWSERPPVFTRWLPCIAMHAYEWPQQQRFLRFSCERTSYSYARVMEKS